MDRAPGQPLAPGRGHGQPGSQPRGSRPVTVFFGDLCPRGQRLLMGRPCARGSRASCVQAVIGCGRRLPQAVGEPWNYCELRGRREGPGMNGGQTGPSPCWETELRIDQSQEWAAVGLSETWQHPGPSASSLAPSSCPNRGPRTSDSSVRIRQPPCGPWDLCLPDQRSPPFGHSAPVPFLRSLRPRPWELPDEVGAHATPASPEHGGASCGTPHMSSRSPREPGLAPADTSWPLSQPAWQVNPRGTVWKAWNTPATPPSASLALRRVTLPV